MAATPQADGYNTAFVVIGSTIVVAPPSERCSSTRTRDDVVARLRRRARQVRSHRRETATMRSAAFSATAMVGALVCRAGTRG